jgi:RNA polymerase sigma-70 factor (ECF subfamily)
MNDLDRELAGIAAGDPESFGRWVAGAEPLLRARLRPLSTRIDAESVLQEVLTRVWTTANRCKRDGRPHALVRYAIRIQHNLAIDELRKARLEATDVDTLERYLMAEEPSEPGYSDPLMRRLVKGCLELLPPKAQAVVRARWESSGLASDSELAAQLNMKLNTFLQNVTRARKLLADCLRSQGADVPGGPR